MNTQREIALAAEDIIGLLRELDSPRDAVCAILTAHVKITLDHGLKNSTIDHMLGQYAAAFKEAYSA